MITGSPGSQSLLHTLWVLQAGFSDVLVASFSGLHVQLLSLTVRKVGGRPGRIYHMMRTAADITFSLLTSGFVLSLSVFFP